MSVLFEVAGQHSTKSLDSVPHIVIPIRASSQGLPAPHFMNGSVVSFGPITAARVTPHVIDSQGLGWLFNCRRSSGITTGELWISQRKVRSIAPQVLSSDLHIEAVINKGNLYIKVLPMRTTTTNRKLESKQPKSSDISRWLQINAKQIKENMTMQSTKIEVLEMPQSCYSAKSSDIALVRSNLVAVLGNEQGTRRLAEMTAHEITTAANALVDNSGNGGCCHKTPVANLKPATIEAMPLPDYKEVV